MTWCSDFASICQTDAPLAELTWYRLGGPARWLFTPTSAGQLADLVRAANAADVPWRVLGRGANVIVPDEGFDGAVIRLTASAFTAIDWPNDDAPVRAETLNEIRVGAGVDFPKLCKQACERGRGGLAGLAGIPGTVGGIIRMNAGGKYGQIADVVSGVEVVTADGAVETWPRDRLEFGYRRSNLAGHIVVGATLALPPGDRAGLLAEHRRVWQEKATDQPPVGARSAGCIFKNPRENPAGLLLDQAGLKGTRVRGAEISPRHANFIVAYQDATAQDVLDLIALAKDRVRERHGVELESEVDLW